MDSIALRPEQIRRIGRPEAAAVCFDWESRAAVQDGADGSPAMAARKRGVRQAAITAALAALIFFVFHWEHVGRVVFGVASVLLLTSLATPLTIYAAIERLVAWIAHRLEKGVTWLLMAVIFNLLFAPFGRLFRSGKRDSMKRWYEPEQETYWNDRAPDAVTADSRRRLY